MVWSKQAKTFDVAGLAARGQTTYLSFCLLLNITLESIIDFTKCSNFQILPKKPEWVDISEYG